MSEHRSTAGWPCTTPAGFDVHQARKAAQREAEDLRENPQVLAAVLHAPVSAQRHVALQQAQP